MRIESPLPDQSFLRHFEEQSKMEDQFVRRRGEMMLVLLDKLHWHLSPTMLYGLLIGDELLLCSTGNDQSFKVWVDAPEGVPPSYRIQPSEDIRRATPADFFWPPESKYKTPSVDEAVLHVVELSTR